MRRIKMKEKIKNQIDNMKNQTIGVEIEMNSITRKKAAELVANFFGTRAWNAASEYGYLTWACKDTSGRVWKFQKDVSIAGLDDENANGNTNLNTRYRCLTRDNQNS